MDQLAFKVQHGAPPSLCCTPSPSWKVPHTAQEETERTVGEGGRWTDS